MNQSEKIVISGSWKQDCKDAFAVNRETLRTILRDNRETEFGKKYRFSEIKSAEDYRQIVPLSDYEDYKSDIQRMRNGETNILTAYPLVGYANSSGTTGGDRKWIPITDHLLDVYGNDPDLYVEKILKEKGGKRIHLSLFRTDPDGPFDGLVVTGIYYRNKYLSGRMDLDSYVGGRALIFDKDPGDVPFAKIYAALLEEELTVMETVFQYDYLHFFKYIEKNWKNLISIMREGVIPEDIPLSAPLRSMLSSLPVCRERVDLLEQEFQKGFAGIAKRIWPKLVLLGGISNPAFFAEEEMLLLYVEDIPRYHFTYAASESYYGNPIAENSSRYAMMPRHDFFEFLPYHGTGDTCTQTCFPEETEIGQEYEVVVTTYAGLYRYRMGDIVRVVDYYEQSPVIEFVTRRGMGLSLAGEKVTLSQLEEAVRKLQTHQLQVEMYCFAPDMKMVPGRYLVVLVPTEKCGVSEADAARMIDEAIKEQNWDYADIRNLGNLMEPKVVFLTMDAYEVMMEANGLLAGQSKPKHIAPNGLRLDYRSDEA